MSEILQYILSAVGLLAVISYGYGQVRKGKNDSRFDTVQLFKEQVEALEVKVSSQQDEIQKLTKEVHQLHVSIEEKDKKLTETLAILQGRDPEMQAFVRGLNEYIAIGKPLMESIVKDVLPTVSKLDKFLNQQKF